MENQLATLGILLASIIVPISTIAMLKVHNANKQYPQYPQYLKGGGIMIEYITPALLVFILAFAIETRMKLAKLCGQFEERKKK